jgi:hypothetical protein
VVLEINFTSVMAGTNSAWAAILAVMVAGVTGF